MACVYTTGWSLNDDCLDGIGSVKDFLFANFSAGTSFSSDSSGIITGATAGPATWYKVEQMSESGLFTFDGTTDPTVGNTVFTHKAEVTLNTYRAEARTLALIMHTSRSFIIAHANEGRYFLLGQENGCYGVSSTGGVGKAYTDANNTIIQFEGRGNKSQPRELSATFIASLTIV